MTENDSSANSQTNVKESRWPVCCSRVGVFLVLFSLCFYFESMGILYVASVIQSVERQFKISSKMSALLVSAHEFGYIPAVVILSYLGSRGNRARWIGAGCLLISFGNFLVSTPGFAFSNRASSSHLDQKEMKNEVTNEVRNMPDSLQNIVIEHAHIHVGYCNASVNRMKIILEREKCDQSSSNKFAYGMVLFSLILIGIGHSTPWSLGVPLIDDNVKRTNMPFFFALLFFIKTVGPATGFFVGGFTNSIYTTLKQPIGMTSEHPQWIGAWWLGYLIIAVALLLPALGLFCFPSDPESDFERLHEDDDENVPKRGLKSRMSFKDKHIKEHEQGLVNVVKKFFASLLEITKSKVYIGAAIGNAIEALKLKGHVIFLPKYMSNHFGISLEKASNITGLSVVGFVTGLIFGGYIMRKLKLEGRKAAVCVGVCSLLNAFIALGFMTLGCHSVVSTIGQLGLKTDFKFTKQCNVDCLCEPVQLLPVCSKSGEPFFSPCHAGCKNMTVAPDTKETSYSDCMCADADNQVSSDWCIEDCNIMLTMFFLLFALSTFVFAVSVTPAGLIMLRSVPAEHRSISLGLSAFFVSLGTLIGPVIFGAIIDSACLKWEHKCDEIGFCSIYEASQLRIRVYALFSALTFSRLVFDIWVWYFAKDLEIMKERDENEKNEKLYGSMSLRKFSVK